MRTVFRLSRALLCLAFLALFSACSYMPRMLGGPADVDLKLDGEQKHATDLPVGKRLTLDMRDPHASGYVFAGTSFDPALLRLDNIEPYDGSKRIRYAFTTLAEGESDIVIKIRKEEPGYRPDVFKRITVTITK
ncbi:hypothetical protein [Humidesulfovibrio idahonensis]